MAETFITTGRATTEAGNLSPVATAFSDFLRTTWPLIRAERDLSSFAGQAWDPAVDAWIREAEVAHEASLAALQIVLATPSDRDGDALMRVVSRAWDRVMRSSDPLEVTDMRHFIDKHHLFRTDRSVVGGAAVNRMLQSGLMRLHLYIGFITAPDADLCDIDTGTPTLLHSTAEVHTALEPCA